MLYHTGAYKPACKFFCRGHSVPDTDGSLLHKSLKVWSRSLPDFISQPHKVGDTEYWNARSRPSLSKWSVVSSGSFTVLCCKSPRCRLRSVLTFVQRTCVNTHNFNLEKVNVQYNRRESSRILILATTVINACAIRNIGFRSSVFKAILHERKAPPTPKHT